MFNKNRWIHVLLNAVTIISVTLIVGSLIYYFSSQSLISNLKDSLVEIASQGARSVEKDIEAHLNIIETVASMDIIKDPAVPWEDKRRILQSEVDRNKIKRMSIANVSGISQTNEGTQTYVGDRKYFIKALTGQKNASDPVISRIDNELSITFSVPIIFKNNIVGVLYATYNIEDLCKIAEEVKFGNSGTAFITNSSEELIAFEDRELLYATYTKQQWIESDPDFQSIKELQKQITFTKSGIGEYTYGAERRFAAYAPIKGTDWFLVVSAPKSHIFRNVYQFLIFAMCVVLLMVVVFVVMRVHMEYLRRTLGRERIKYRTAINTSKLLVIAIDPKGAILDINRHARIRTGLRVSEVIGKKNIFDLVPENSRDIAQQILCSIKDGEVMNGFEMPLMNKDGVPCHILWNVSVIKDKEDDGIQIEILGIDMTDRVEYEKKILATHDELTALYEELTASEEELKQQFGELAGNQDQLRRSEERYSFVIEASDMGIWDYDLLTGQRVYSPRWYEIFGMDPKKPGMNESEWNWYEHVHPDDSEKVRHIIEEHLENKTGYYECECRVKIANGKYKWIKAVGRTLWDLDGNPVRMAGSHTDITEEKEYENRIQRLAYYDGLTGLPNRVQLEEKASALIREGKCRAALFFIDIDNFKYVNDSFGHSFGDSLIIEMSNRITSITAAESLVARLGGDEMTVLMVDVRNVEQVKKFANELVNILNINCSTQGVTLNVSASIGIAMFPEDGESFEELLKNADTAMYRAKESGKRHYRFYNKEMNKAIYDRIMMESNLRRAINDNEFVLYYQPQYDVKEGTIHGFEALLRWNDPVNGFISPLRFVPLAEETELIIPIGKWVLKSACEFIVRMHRNGFEGLAISVNVSVIQLLQDDFVDNVLEILYETGMDPEYLELEITESILMECIESNLEKIERLRKERIRVALDDFGTGYSSLTYLKQLPITTLKIERAFVHNMVKCKEDRDITGAIITLAHLLGVGVVAEGVETWDQLACLEELHCDMIQGYLASTPLPEAEIIGSMETLRRLWA